MFGGVALQLLAVQIAEDDLADEGMRFEEGNKALGKSARADDADAQAHGGKVRRVDRRRNRTRT